MYLSGADTGILNPVDTPDGRVRDSHPSRGPGPGRALSPPGDSAIGLIAHDHKKAQLVDFAVCYRDVLSRHQLVATATTGMMLQEMVGLDVSCVRAGRDGGDFQIAQFVVGRRMLAVIYLIDPFGRLDNEPELDPVLRVCNLHDIPVATNISTAAAVLNSLAMLEASLSIDRASLADK
ncbi:MAG: methylglyoxal synthase [Candidatus Dormiibacterota bacterium]